MARTAGRLVLPIMVVLGCAGQPPPPEVDAILDVAYGADERHRLDIYRPKGVTGKLPAVLWIHGGGWREGDKRSGVNGISTLAPALVGRGYVAIACNYRFTPKHRHPAQVDDVRRAVRWLRANADRYNIDPDRIGAAGISAGGHLACRLGVRDDGVKKGDDLDRIPGQVRALVSLNGPTDLREGRLPSPPVLAQAFRDLAGDDPAALASASPLLFAGRDFAPALFIVGSEDPLVPIDHSKRMVAALQEHGVEARLHVIRGAGHGIFPGQTPEARDALLDFFDSRLKP